MNETDLRAWLTLRALDGVGAVTLWSLVQAWGSPQAILDASEEALRSRGCSELLAKIIRRGLDRGMQHVIDKEVRGIAKRKLTMLSCLDETYPARLRTIPDPPSLLYVTGEWRVEDACAVAIVGSRRVSTNGRLATEQISRDLAQAGFTIVSGLARGVDGSAHRAALDVGGRTIAVLGCGIDRLYPPEHATLRKHIEGRGAVLSEFPLGAPPHSYHFPQRNRLISALAYGVVVTEASLESGSLITARLAAEQGRDVFAMPGSVRDASSRGTNRLIKEGATLVETADDVIAALLPQLDPLLRERLSQRPTPSHQPVAPSTGGEAVILACLSGEAMHIDAVTARARLSGGIVASHLLALEMKGLVRQLPGQFYLRL